LIAVLPSATIEVLFTVVADDVMPATLDAIIGWDIIGLPHLKLLKTDDGLELHHDRLNPYKVLTIKNDDQNNINVSGMDEPNVQLHHIATGVPRGNGKVERVMRTVFNLLRATLTAE
jgi:hypothetical protein